MSSFTQAWEAVLDGLAQEFTQDRLSDCKDDFDGEEEIEYFLEREVESFEIALRDRLRDANNDYWEMTECDDCEGSGACPTCDGRGHDDEATPCEDCKGTGQCQTCDGSGEVCRGRQ